MPRLSVPISTTRTCPNGCQRTWAGHRNMGGCAAHPPLLHGSGRLGRAASAGPCQTTEPPTRGHTRMTKNMALERNTGLGLPFYEEAAVMKQLQGLIAVSACAFVAVTLSSWAQAQDADTMQRIERAISVMKQTCGITHERQEYRAQLDLKAALKNLLGMRAGAVAGYTRAETEGIVSTLEREVSKEGALLSQRQLDCMAPWGAEFRNILFPRQAAPPSPQAYNPRPPQPPPVHPAPIAPSIAPGQWFDYQGRPIQTPNPCVRGGYHHMYC